MNGAQEDAGSARPDFQLARVCGERGRGGVEEDVREEKEEDHLVVWPCRASILPISILFIFKTQKHTSRRPNTDKYIHPVLLSLCLTALLQLF